MDAFDDLISRRLGVRSKVWVEAEGQPLIGSGKADLLRAIEGAGSIHAAAKQLGMDYHRAWGLIDSMEQRLGFKLVARRRGGAGGGAKLTDEACRLLELYEAFERRSQSAADRQFERIFRGQRKGRQHVE
jgi:molybdate transport system regulatory protein